MAGAKALEGRQHLFVLFQAGHKVRGDDQLLLRFRLQSWSGLYPGIVKTHCFFDVTEQHVFFWQIGYMGDTAKLAHAGLFAAPGSLVLAEDQRPIPEAERAVRFEGRHAAQNSLVHEMREAPLYRLFHLRARRMDQPPKVVEDRFGEISGLGNIGVYSRIFFWHNFGDYAFFAAVLSTLIWRKRATGHPWLTALAWVGSPLPSLAAPCSS